MLVHAPALPGDTSMPALGGPHDNTTCMFRLRTEPNNHYRLRRMLEILITSGRTMAEMDLDTSAPLDYDFRCFFLNSSRIDLLRRIDARCETMVPRGLLEVWGKRGCVPWNCVCSRHTSCARPDKQNETAAR